MLAAAVGLTAVSLALLPCYLRRPNRMAQPLRAAIAARGSATGGQLGQYLDSVSRAAAALREGQLVAFPTETVYGLGAHALDAAACARIFEVKGRPRSDPLIVHVPSVEAAESLVRLEPEGLTLLRRLAESFWPGPLTIVAPACEELPVEVTSGSGFVGVRCPNHALAIELLREAAVPVAAPSANRFGHVSPTRPEHVMDDLGAHAIFVLRQSAAEGCCDVGIESTVLKLSEETQQLILLRRGGVPEAELARWVEAEGGAYSFVVQVAHKPHTPPAPAAAPDSAAGGAAAEEALMAPGMLLTHYAPDAPSFLFAPAASVPDTSQAESIAPIGGAVLLDFGGKLTALEGRAFAYKDLSPSGDATEAAAALFGALRWAEKRANDGGRCVLLPDLGGDELSATPPDGATVEHVPALSDRLFRAASGKRARLAADQLVPAE